MTFAFASKKDFARKLDTFGLSSDNDEVVVAIVSDDGMKYPMKEKFRYVYFCAVLSSAMFLNKVPCSPALHSTPHCCVMCYVVPCRAVTWLHSLKRHQSIMSNISPRASLLLALSVTIIWNGNVQTIASHNGWNGYNIKILKICWWTHAFNSFKWLSLPCLPSSSSSACHMPIIAMAPPLLSPPTHPPRKQVKGTRSPLWASHL